MSAYTEVCDSSHPLASGTDSQKATGLEESALESKIYSVHLMVVLLQDLLDYLSSEKMDQLVDPQALMGNFSKVRHFYTDLHKLIVTTIKDRQKSVSHMKKLSGKLREINSLLTMLNHAPDDTETGQLGVTQEHQTEVKDQKKRKRGRQTKCKKDIVLQDLPIMQKKKRDTTEPSEQAKRKNRSMLQDLPLMQKRRRETGEPLEIEWLPF
jgi:hypothetical protein